MKNGKEKNGKIGIFGFFAFTAASMMSMVLFPTFASSGFNLIFFLVLAAFFWFIPVALASVEMASIKKWKDGGIFDWVKNTMSERWGFAAVFYQWFQTTIIYTIFFYFLTSGIDYLFQTTFLDNSLFQFFIIILAFLVVTFINLFGIKVTTTITRFSLPIGVILPTLLLIVLAFSFVFGSGKATIPPTLDMGIFPTTSIFEFVIFSSFLLSMTAIEVSANAINILKKSNRNYPIVIGILIITLITFNTLAGLSIALVLSPEEIGLSDAIFLAFDKIISTWFGIEYIWIAKLITVLIIFGIIGQVSAIIVEPSIGITNALKTLNAPKWISKKNRFNVTYNILLIQTILMIIWLSIITFTSSDSNLAMTICISITSSTYLLTYILLLTSHLLITWKSSELERSFGIKNKWIKTIVSSVGLVLTIGTMIIMFLKPLQNISGENYLVYILVLLISLIVIISMPFIFYELLKKRKLTPKIIQ